MQRCPCTRGRQAPLSQRLLPDKGAMLASNEEALSDPGRQAPGPAHECFHPPALVTCTGRPRMTRPLWCGFQCTLFMLRFPRAKLKVCTAVSAMSLRSCCPSEKARRSVSRACNNAERISASDSAPALQRGSPRARVLMAICSALLSSRRRLIRSHSAGTSEDDSATGSNSSSTLPLPNGLAHGGGLGGPLGAAELDALSDGRAFGGYVGRSSAHILL